MSTVSLRNLHKTYLGANGQEVTAVDGVSIEIADREFLVLVGPSGSGKSTILRMIAGLEGVAGGDILLDGRSVNDVPPKDRDIAMVFQSYALYPHMNVRDNIAFGLKLRGYPVGEIKRRVTEAAELLGIEALLGRKPRQLSGGQRQRVAVGRAIVRQPKVFLFDEPFSNLDAKMRVQTRAELIRLHKRLQATMIYVTHDQVEAMTMGNRIAIMEDGRLQQIDTPLTLYREPKNLFVAGFLGSPSMNFIRGQISREGCRLIFRELPRGSIEVCYREEEHPVLRNYADKEIILGVRPEEIVWDNAAAGPDDAVFTAMLDLVEPMGAETNFHLQTGAHILTCRSMSVLDSHELGCQLRFRFNRAKAHLFDPVTNNRII